VIGYMSVSHVGPAVLGCTVYFVGLALTWTRAAASVPAAA